MKFDRAKLGRIWLNWTAIKFSFFIGAICGMVFQSLLFVTEMVRRGML